MQQKSLVKRKRVLFFEHSELILVYIDGELINESQIIGFVCQRLLLWNMQKGQVVGFLKQI